MPKILCWTLLLCILSSGLLSSAASNHLYVIDTSRSMRTHRKALTEAVTQDIERALKNGSYAAGDRIQLWAFTSDVSELLNVQYEPSREADLRTQINSKLKRLKTEGLTSIAKPLIKALEEFGPSDVGEVSIFLYTDGRASVSAADAEKILRLYNHHLKPNGRLRHAFLVQLGKEELPKATQALITSLGGNILVGGRALEILPRPGIVEPVQPTNQTTVSVLPKAIQFSSSVAPEIVKPVPLEFAVNPSHSVSIGLDLSATALPEGMMIGTTADRIATEGRQSVTFWIKNAVPGRYTATLKLSAPAVIQPEVIPVEIEIVPAKPGQIGLHFYPEHLSLLELPAQGQWQNIAHVGLSLFYPESLSETQVRFDCQTPEGVEIQFCPGRDPAKVIGPGAIMKLSELGRTVGLQIRQSSQDIVGKELSAHVSVHVEAGQNVNSIGTNSMVLPFRFSLPVEVKVETPELVLGDIAPGTRSVKNTLTLRVQGQPDGKKVRLVKQGQGLAGIAVAPSEIALKPGLMSVDVEFSGFESRKPEPITGSLALVGTEDGSSMKVHSAPIPVRGRIAEPPRILAEIENPMVTGQPLIIRARFDSGHRGSFSAVVHPPNSKKSFDLVLVDTGAIEDGDSQRNDGLYSGVFKQTDALGAYRIAVRGQGASSAVENVSASAVIYFKAPARPLLGTIARRKQNELLHLSSMIVSEFPTAVALYEDAGASKKSLPTFLSNKGANKTLERGENRLDLSIELTPEVQPGNYKYQISLITDPVAGTKAKIPLFFEIRVLSFFQYFMRMLAIALALALVGFLAAVTPWKKISLRNVKHVRSAQPENEHDSLRV